MIKLYETYPLYSSRCSNTCKKIRAVFKTRVIVSIENFLYVFLPGNTLECIQKGLSKVSRLFQIPKWTF